MTSTLCSKIIIIFLSILTAGCSTSPKLLPNDHLLKVGKEQSDKDIQDCLTLADTYSSDPTRWKEIAGSTAKAAVIGSAAGAVGGAIVNNAGRGTAIGAATAAVTALLYELSALGDADPSYKSFVEYCLKKRGYETSNWR